jgi:hypothetical protein
LFSGWIVTPLAQADQVEDFYAQYERYFGDRAPTEIPLPQRLECVVAASLSLIPQD